MRIVDPSQVETDEHARSGARLRSAMPLYYALLLAILTVVGLALLVRLRHVLLILFISYLLAAATSGPAGRLHRARVPLGLAVALIYLVAVAIVGFIGWLVVPPLFEQLAGLMQQLPDYADRYQSLRQSYDELRRQYPDIGPLSDQVKHAGSGVSAAIAGWLANLPTQLFGLFLDLLSVLVISALLVTTRRELLELAVTLAGPGHAEPVRRVLTRSWHQVGYYVRAKLIEMLIIGAITYVALRLIGIPFAVPLAVLVAFGEAIPRVGPWLARLPLLAVAALQSWTDFALAFVASIAIENLKGFVIAPVVEGNQLDIPPLLVFVAVLVGSALLGVSGAFVAVPAAAIVQIIFEEVILPWRRNGFRDPTGTHGTIRPSEES